MSRLGLLLTVLYRCSVTSCLPERQSSNSPAGLPIMDCHPHPPPSACRREGGPRVGSGAISVEHAPRAPGSSGTVLMWPDVAGACERCAARDPDPNTAGACRRWAAARAASTSGGGSSGSGRCRAARCVLLRRYEKEGRVLLRAHPSAGWALHLMAVITHLRYFSSHVSSQSLLTEGTANARDRLRIL